MSSQHLQFPAIDPVIFSLGPISLHWYGLMYLIGFAGAMYFANRRIDQPGCYWNKEQISDLLFYGFIGVIAGGRAGYVFFYQFDLFLVDPLYLFKLWEGGMSFHGGFLGVLVAFFFFAKRTQTTFFQVADFIAPMVPIGLGAGRLGNFINAELWGRETDVPWAMVFPTDSLGLARHPSQLYEFFLEGLVLFVFLNWFRKGNRPVGAVAGFFSLGYGAFRFIVEYYREPDAHLGLFGGVISMGQILSLPMVFAGIGILMWAYKQPAKLNEKNT